MSKYAPGDTFFVLIDEELMVCEILDKLSKYRVRVNFKRNMYGGSSVSYVPFQVVRTDYLDEIFVDYNELLDYLEVDLAYT